MLRRISLLNDSGQIINPATEDTISSLVDIFSYKADETNIFLDFARNNGNINQNVDGSVTPVYFSTPEVPAGKILHITRLMIYMEDSTAFSSEVFAGLPSPLSNGWSLVVNGYTIASAVDNKSLAIFMFDLTGNALFGKENQTMVGRFSFSDFTNGSDGVYIRAGQTIGTMVNDNLTGIDHLNVMFQGVYKNL